MTSIKSYTLITSVVLSLFFLTVLASPSETQAVVQSLNNQTGQNQSFQNDSNITISSSNNVHTIGWQGYLPVSRGGTGAGSFTSGSLLFYNGSTFAQDNTYLFWDDSNNRLGVGTSSPSSALDVSGTIKASSLNSTSDSNINSLTIGLGGGSVSTNTALGKNALQNNSDGADNLAVGLGALQLNNIGNANVALGLASLGKNTNGSENTTIGWYSFLENLTGSGNVVIGRNAATVQADGSSHLTTAYNGVYIGKNVRGYSNSDNHSIVIGTDAIGAGSFKAVIGSSDITDVYFGSTSANADIHANKLYLGSSSIPGCIIMGDTSGGVGYITLDNGSLTVSATAPSTCQ